MFYGVEGFNYRPDDPQLRAKGYSAIEKALALDPQSAEAHYARGILIWQPSKACPHRAALDEFRLALTRQPNLDDAWHHRGVVLMHIGHLEHAGEFYQRALALNPVNTLARFRFAPLRNYQQRYDDAITVLRRVPQDIYPSQWTYHMGWSLVTLGRMREAAQEIEAMLASNRADQGGVIHATRALLRAKTGDRRGAEADIAAAIELGKGFGHFHHTALTIGEVYALLGDLDRAQEWVEKAANDGFPNYSFFEVDPHLASLRATERFRRFLQQLRREWEHIARRRRRSSAEALTSRDPVIGGIVLDAVGQTLGGRPRRIARWAAVVVHGRRIGNRRTVRNPTPREHQGFALLGITWAPGGKGSTTSTRRPGPTCGSAADSTEARRAS